MNETQNPETCDSSCAGCAADCPSRREPQSFQEPMNRFSDIKKVIAVVSGKGGVGKSLVTALMASAAAKNGARTAVLDADVTGPSIPKLFGLDDRRASASEEGILPVTADKGIKLMSVNLLLENTSDPVIWRGPVIAGVVKQFWNEVVWGDIDYMFVDMPPGTGDVPLTVFQSLPLSGVVIVASPQQLVGMIVEKAVKMAEMMNIPVLGLVENMSYYVCPDCGAKHSVFGESGIEEIARRHGVKTIARLPLDPSIAQKCDLGLVPEIDGPWMEELFSIVKNT